MDQYEDNKLAEKAFNEISIKEVPILVMDTREQWTYRELEAKPSIKEVPIPVMDTREQWTYRRAYQRIKEMQVNIDNIMKNNREHLKHLSEKENQDLLEFRKRVTHETRAFMKKYK
jgi:hypothetical protein